MDDHNHKSDDAFFDSRSLLSQVERECIRDIEGGEDLVDLLQDQRESAIERLWSTFQVAASSLTQLHKERTPCNCCERCLYKHNNHDRWLPFQASANKVTMLYKDGSDALCAAIELGYRAGYQKRNRDITNWVKKKRRNIRREDILTNLSGRSPPRRRVNEKALSPKPMSPTHDHTTFPDTREFDFTAFVEGRNPYSNEIRKRHNDANSMESPHKRGKFC